jgi:hypothetical protein
MKVSNQNAASQSSTTRSKLPKSSIFMYVAAIIVFLIAVAAVVMDVYMFQKTVAQYVEQGYPADLVMKQLIPGQLLPGLFDAVAVYAGVACLLFAAGFINHKIAVILKAVRNEPENNDTTSEPPETSETSIFGLADIDAPSSTADPEQAPESTDPTSTDPTSTESTNADPTAEKLPGQAE